MLSAAAGDGDYTPKRAESGLQDWIDCFEKAELKGTLFFGGMNDPNDINENAKLNKAYEMGERV